MTTSEELGTITQSLQDFAERFNGHAGEYRCCCDRCKHLVEYCAALLFFTQADAVDVVHKGLMEARFIDLKGSLVLQKTAENMRAKGEIMQSRARSSWEAAKRV